MGGKDQVGLLGDQELSGDVHALGLDGLDLILEDDRVDDHAVTDDIDRIRTEDAGGNRVQHETVPVEDEGVSGVGAALEAGDHLVIRGQDIDHLSFALVAPLQAEDHVNLTHSMPVRLKI